MGKLGKKATSETISFTMCFFFLQVSIKPWGIIKEAQHIFQSRPFASSNPTQNKQTFVFKPKPI